MLPYQVHPPSKLSSTARWIESRGNPVLRMIEHRPDDRNLPNVLKQVEIVLAWRAAIPPEERFWKAD